MAFKQHELVGTGSTDLRVQDQGQTTAVDLGHLLPESTSMKRTRAGKGGHQRRGRLEAWGRRGIKQKTGRRGIGGGGDRQPSHLRWEKGRGPPLRGRG